MIKINLNGADKKFARDFLDILKRLEISYEIEKTFEFDGPLSTSEVRVVFMNLKTLTTDSLDQLSAALKNDRVSVIFSTESHEFPTHLREQVDQWVRRYHGRIFFTCQSDDELIRGANLKVFLTHVLKKIESQYNEISSSVAHLLQRSLSELQRVKELHEKIVPMRFEKIKGLSLYSKFGAGQEKGGEFFDIVKSDMECLILITSSQSYVGSSIVLAHFEQFQQKEKITLEDIEIFLNELFLDLRDRGVFKNGESLSLFIAKVDLGKMSLEGHQFGDFRIFSSLSETHSGNELDLNPNFFEKSHFTMKLERNGKFVILSPGTVQNLRESYSLDEIKSLANDLVKKPAKAAINEVFYQMDRLKSGSFLNYDSTVLFLEVDPNVIIEV